MSLSNPIIGEVRVRAVPVPMPDPHQTASGWPEISAHLMAVTPTAHWLEYADWWNPILRDPLQVSAGMAQSSDAPGSGIDWNEDAVGRYLA
jgi:L-alanine-DL-glutamate epimerase-like enolase superfamily enzyme